MAKKSSFLGQLGKGFIRSAVNQVGRDGGRVISNQVYGDAHSTPIRGVGAQGQYSTPMQVESFFSIDIHNLAIYTQGNIGNTVIPIQGDMGLFTSAEIVAFHGGRFNVSFFAPHAALTPQLVAFVDSCIAIYGKDSYNKQRISKKDYDAIRVGSFNRMWNNLPNKTAIMIVQSGGTLHLNLMNIQQTSVAIGKPTQQTPPPLPIESIPEVEVVEVKQTIEEFFSIDIHRLGRYFDPNGADFIERNGKKIRYKNVRLNNDMGIFYKAEIIGFEGGSYNISFWSQTNEITPEICDFVQLCTKVFGTTKNGEGDVVQQDYNHAKCGLFSRMWDRVWVDMETDEKIIHLIVACPVGHHSGVGGGRVQPRICRRRWHGRQPLSGGHYATVGQPCPVVAHDHRVYRHLLRAHRRLVVCRLRRQYHDLGYRPGQSTVCRHVRRRRTQHQRCDHPHALIRLHRRHRCGEKHYHRRRERQGRHDAD